jgi:hypothetical protein
MEAKWNPEGPQLMQHPLLTSYCNILSEHVPCRRLVVHENSPPRTTGTIMVAREFFVSEDTLRAGTNQLLKRALIYGKTQSTVRTPYIATISFSHVLVHFEFQMTQLSESGCQLEAVTYPDFRLSWVQIEGRHTPDLKPL